MSLCSSELSLLPTLTSMCWSFLKSSFSQRTCLQANESDSRSRVTLLQGMWVSRGENNVMNTHTHALLQIHMHRQCECEMLSKTEKRVCLFTWDSTEPRWNSLGSVYYVFFFFPFTITSFNEEKLKLSRLSHYWLWLPCTSSRAYSTIPLRLTLWHLKTFENLSILLLFIHVLGSCDLGRYTPGPKEFAARVYSIW